MFWKNRRKRPDVSVIIPCYNVKSYIDKCIKSALSQKKIAVEVIAIDDCSTDGTRQRVQALANWHPSIKLIALEENVGQAKARNIGIEHARAPYISFLDSDDYYHSKTVLAKWVGFARDNNCDMVRANLHRVNAKQKYLSTGSSLGIVEGSVFGSVEDHPEFTNASECWQFVYRKDFLNDNSLRFSANLRQREDRLFFVQALLKAGKIGAVPDIGICHRIHADSTMSNPSWPQLEMFATHIEEFNEFAATEIDPKKFPLFLKNNLLFYMRTAQLYWRDLLTGRASHTRPEFARFFAALAKADWGVTCLYDATHLDLEDDMKRFVESKYFDIIRTLARHERYEDLAYLLKKSGYAPHDVLNRSHLVDLLDESVLCDHLARHEARDFQDELPAAAISINWSRKFAGRTPRMLLHLGMPKTGSSSLQAYLECNRFRALENGLYYPVSGVERGLDIRQNRTGGHARMITGILGNDKSLGDQLIAEIVQLPAPPGTVVVSAENIVSHRFWDGFKTIGTIADCFQMFDIHPVIYLRAQHSWLESMYNEVLSNPTNELCASPEEFVERHMQYGFLDYDALIDYLHGTFGKDRVTVFCYEKERGRGGTIAAFCDAFGIKIDDPFDVPKTMANTTTSARLALSMRELKKQGVDRNVRKKVFEQLVADDDGNSRLIPTALLEQVKSEYRQSNQRAAEANPDLALLNEVAVPAAPASHIDLDALQAVLRGVASDYR